jgi:hypothetical protein
METIDFIRNFDDKLCRPHFTTIRRHHPTVFQRDKVFLITLKRQPLFYARIVDIRQIFIPTLSDYISYMDMGYCAADGKEILMDLYRGSVKDFEHTLFDFIILERIGHNDKCKTTQDSCSVPAELLKPLRLE